MEPQLRELPFLEQVREVDLLSKRAREDFASKHGKKRNTLGNPYPCTYTYIRQFYIDSATRLAILSKKFDRGIVLERTNHFGKIIEGSQRLMSIDANVMRELKKQEALRKIVITPSQIRTLAKFSVVHIEMAARELCKLPKTSASPKGLTLGILRSVVEQSSPSSASPPSSNAPAPPTCSSDGDEPQSAKHARLATHSSPRAESRSVEDDVIMVERDDEMTSNTHRETEVDGDGILETPSYNDEGSTAAGKDIAKRTSTARPTAMSPRHLSGTRTRASAIGSDEEENARRAVRDANDEDDATHRPGDCDGGKNDKHMGEDGVEFPSFLVEYETLMINVNRRLSPIERSVRSLLASVNDMEKAADARHTKTAAALDELHDRLSTVYDELNKEQVVTKERNRDTENTIAAGVHELRKELRAAQVEACEAFSAIAKAVGCGAGKRVVSDGGRSVVISGSHSPRGGCFKPSSIRVKVKKPSRGEKHSRREK